VCVAVVSYVVAQQAKRHGNQQAASVSGRATKGRAEPARWPPKPLSHLGFSR